jgi:hypothetical protein
VYSVPTQDPTRVGQLGQLALDSCTLPRLLTGRTKPILYPWSLVTSLAYSLPPYPPTPLPTHPPNPFCHYSFPYQTQLTPTQSSGLPQSQRRRFYISHFAS